MNWLTASSKSQQLPVVDAHLHLTNHNAVGEYPAGVQDWFNDTGVKAGRAETDPNRGDFSEQDYLQDNVSSGLKDGREAAVNHRVAVFIEVLPEGPPAVKEAAWALLKADDSQSVVAAVVAHIPVTEGRTGVSKYLEELRAELASEGNEWAIAENARVAAGPSGDSEPMNHPRLRGARQVFNGEGKVHDEAIRDPKFIEGLHELGRHGLHFEFCVRAPRLRYAAETAKECPGTRFVLDHCGLNGTGQNFEQWKSDLAALAALPNVVGCKLSAIEEWDPVGGDPGPYVDAALSIFGPARCMYGSNWFVPKYYPGPPAFAHTALLVAAALDRAEASPSDIQLVFGGTAATVYNLADKPNKATAE